MPIQQPFDVSIIITSFNHRAYLVDALESVIAQTVMPREILVADDGSTDGSVETIKAYANRFPGWVIPVLHGNMGIPRNRNSALDRVRGAYVGVLDGDDLFLPDKLERQQAAFLRAPDAGVIYGNFLKFTEDGAQAKLRYDTPQPEGDVLFDIANLNFGIMRTMIARTDAVKAANCMDPALPKYDGFWLTIQLAAAHRFGYVDAPLVKKRIHPGSDSGLNMNQDLKDLSLIFQRTSELTAHLPAGQRALLQSRWQERIALLEARTS